MITVKNKSEIIAMREACRRAADVRDAVAAQVMPGVTTAELAACAEVRMRELGCVSAFLNYRGFPGLICVSVNDEVVHGKRSLLFKMPGDIWQKFANLRLLYSYMWTHPGKKILFMGGEFGQLSEWYCKTSLDWHLVEERPLHRQVQTFVKTLNRFYREQRALWEEDHDYRGFQWLDFKDVNNSIIAFARKAKDPNDHLVCLLNFTPQVHYDYKLGVLEDVAYRQVLCSDSAMFGGSDVDNSGAKMPIHEPFGEAPMHIRVTVPPLGGVIFKPDRG